MMTEMFNDYDKEQSMWTFLMSSIRFSPKLSIFRSGSNTSSFPAILYMINVQMPHVVFHNITLFVKCA